MFSKLKRFLSVSLCLIFYIFLFAGNFGGNSVCSAAERATVKKYVPIDISGQYNSNAIWGNGDSWGSDFATTNQDRTKGVDGAFAFYTNSNHNNGMPDDGRATIGGIPFNFNSQSGNDCIKLCPALERTTCDINICDIKVKNIYIIGTAGAINTKFTSEAGIEIYDKSDNEITKYSQTLDVYDWYDETTLGSVKGTEQSSIEDYKKYGDRAVVKNESGDYAYSNACIQCWRLNKFSGNTFGDEEIGKIKVTFNGNRTKKEDKSKDIYSECCFTIFAVTAEVEPDEDENITISDVKYNQLKIACGTSGDKQVKISTTEGLSNESMETKMFPYTHKADEGTTYYCTIYDKTKKAYYYFDITAKKSLKIVVQTPSGLVYNGAAQQLVTGCSTLDANGNPRPADEDELLKPNIYLRIENSTGTPAHKTDWYNLNSLANLTATNAGIYNIYYELDKGALSDYDLISTTVVSGTSESNNSIIIDENGD